jgi:hypothetical protein
MVARTNTEIGRHLPTIPDVGGLALLDAALTYASVGIYLLLVRTGKHPGSHAGKGWPAKSTCDPDTITEWCAANPGAGIAIHTGRSGLVAFDLDVDVIPGELAWLKSGLFQSTRGGRGARGHYVFASSETFTSGKLRTADGRVVGEVRSGNTVIVTQPSPHSKADDGGEYRWITTGIVPALPDAARAYLTAKAGGVAQRVPVRTNAELDAWYAAHTEEREPWRRQTFRDHYAKLRRDGQSHHDAMMKVLGWAAREIEAGFVSADVFDDLYDDWWASFGADDRTPPPGEIEKMVVRTIADLAKESADDLRDRGHRDFGTDHRDYLGVFDGLRFVVDPGQIHSADSGDDTARSATVCLADVPPKRVEWLWKGWLPLGKVSIFEGESDVGKSTVTLSWASIVSRGSRWPETVINGKPLLSQHDPAGVVLVGVEDANDDTVVPRLIAAGADLRRVHALARPVDDKGQPRPFTIPDDINWLRRAINEVGAKLVVIDPITACLPESARHGVDSSIRRILMCLVDLARETDSAIVLIRHFNKATGMSAKNRGGGSVAYGALVRSVLSAGKLTEPTDKGGEFAIARAIGNLSKAPQTITYALVDAPNSADLPTPEDSELGVAVVKWRGTTDLTADQLVGADGAKVADARKSAPMRDDAEDALQQVLAGGPVKMTEAVAETMRIAGCSKATVKLAAKKLGIVKDSVYGSNGKIDHWTWRLPPDVVSMITTAGTKQNAD